MHVNLGFLTLYSVLLPLPRATFDLYKPMKAEDHRLTNLEHPIQVFHFTGEETDVKGDELIRQGHKSIK